MAEANIHDTYVLHSRADRVIRSAIASKLEPHDITLMEWLLLGLIADGSKTGHSMSLLAETLGVTLPQITALMAQLLKKRLVRQKTAKKDRRSRLAIATQRGEELFQSAKFDVEAATNELFSRLPATQVQFYKRTIESLAKSPTKNNI